MVAELSVEIISALDERAQAAVAGVFGKAGVIADGAPWLARLVVAAKGSSCRDTYQSVGLHTSLHHHVDDACREKSAPFFMAAKVRISEGKTKFMVKYH